MEGLSNSPLLPLEQRMGMLSRSYRPTEPILYEIERELASQAEHPPRKDMRRGAFAQGMLMELQDPEILESIAYVVDSRTRMGKENGPSHIAKLWIDAIIVQQKLSFRRNGFPAKYITPESWRGLNHDIHNDDSKLGEFYKAMLIEPQRNVVGRYRSLKLFMEIMKPRIGSNPRILDLACSQNLGPKAVSLNMRFQKLLFTPQEEPEDSRERRRNRRLERHINRRISAKYLVGACVGLDIIPIDADGGKGALCSTFSPTELLNRKDVRAFKHLVKQKVPNVGFVEADFVQRPLNPAPRDEVAFNSFREGNFDVVFISAATYLLNEEQQADMIENAMQLATDEGFVIMQDHADPCLRSNDSRPLPWFRILKNWFNQPYPFRTFVLDKKYPEMGFQEIFRWKDDRCQRLQLGLGELCVRGQWMDVRRAIDSTFSIKNTALRGLTQLFTQPRAN